MVSLQSLVRRELIFSDLESTDCVSALHELAGLMVDAGRVPDSEELFRKLHEREKLGSTGIGSGVAVPHCKCTDLGEILLAVGLSRTGIEFGADDGVPVRLLFVVLSPAGAPAEHLQCLAAISRWIRTNGYLDRILASQDHEAIYRLLSGSSGEAEPSIPEADSVKVTEPTTASEESPIG